GLEDLASDYAHLLTVMRNRLPFRLHGWHVTWWNHFRRDLPGTRDSLMFRVVRQQNGTPVGIIPFVLTEWPGSGPVRASALRLLGADPYLTEVRAPLVDPAWEPHIARAIL